MPFATCTAPQAGRPVLFCGASIFLLLCRGRLLFFGPRVRGAIKRQRGSNLCQINAVGIRLARERRVHIERSESSRDERP